MERTDGFWRKLGFVSILCSIFFFKFAIVDPLSLAAQGHDRPIGAALAFCVFLPILGIGLLIGGKKFANFIDISNKPMEQSKVVFYIALLLAITITSIVVLSEQKKLVQAQFNAIEKH